MTRRAKQGGGETPPRAGAKVTPLSLRAYARLRGCSAEAVSKAVQAGRLTRSIVRDASGAPKVADPALADREWAATTRSDMRPHTGPGGSEAELDIPDLAESRARRERAEAELAEMKRDELKGSLLEASDVERRLVEVFTRSKTKLLGVPARARQRDPTLTAAQLSLFEELLREALEDLADAGAREEPKRGRKRPAAEARA